jgi:hypothetical protein
LSWKAAPPYGRLHPPVIVLMPRPSANASFGQTSAISTPRRTPENTRM